MPPYQNTPRKRHRAPFGSFEDLFEPIIMTYYRADSESLRRIMLDLEAVRLRIDLLHSQGDVQWAAEGADVLSNLEEKYKLLKEDFDIGLQTDDTDLLMVIRQIQVMTMSIGSALRKIRQEVDIALEWSELHSMTFLDLEREMMECKEIVDDIRKQSIEFSSVTAPSEEVDIDGLLKSLQQSPMPGYGKLVSLNEQDKKQNALLFKLSQKLQPLKASLSFLDIRIDDFRPKLEKYFPNVLSEVIEEKEQIENLWAKLFADTESIKRQLGEERWSSTLKDAVVKARKLISRLKLSINDAAGKGVHINGSPAPRGHYKKYESSANELIPEIQKIFSLLKRSQDNRIVADASIHRDYVHLSSFWNDVEDEIKRMDRQHGLKVYSLCHNEACDAENSSRLSLGSLRSLSSSSSTFEFTFRANRSSSAASNFENEYLLSESAALPTDEDSVVQAQTPVINDTATDTLTVSKIRQHKSDIGSQSAIPVRKRPSLGPDSYDAPQANSRIPRAVTPGTGFRETKRRVSGKFQPVTAGIPANSVPPVPKVFSSINSALKKPHATEKFMKPTSTVISSSANRYSLTTPRKTSTDLGMARQSTARKSLIPGPTPSTPHYTTGTITAMAKKCTPRSVSSTLKSKSSTASTAKDPFTTVPGNTLNHHASTPNLHSLANKQSRLKILGGSPEKKSIPPVPSIPSRSKTSAAETYKITPGLSPSSQRKFYIKYNDQDGEPTDAGQFSPVKTLRRTTAATGARKSIATSTATEKPRWR
ncbi:hypothetical protein V1514DRAFT_323142 [Lipomyces japonicus]|uniref:uncharacterized protein n=1 Tax=Lipomyces japonicus TaxID=56871 RepID=UPI0034CE2E47